RHDATNLAVGHIPASLFSYSRDGKVKRRSLIGLRFHPDLPAILLQKALADGQSYAGSRDIAAMQPLEHAKDTLLMLGGDAHTVIPEGEQPMFAAVFARDDDAR